jgi:hypothetical protein
LGIGIGRCKHKCSTGNCQRQKAFQHPILPDCVSGTLQAALFAIPSHAADSAEDAIEWISEQLADDEDISDKVLQFDGTSFGPHGEKAVTLDEFFSCW